MTTHRWMTADNALRASAASALQALREAKKAFSIVSTKRSLECVQSAGTEPVIASTADEDGEVQSKRCGDSSFKVDVGKGGRELLNFKMRGIEMHMQLVYKGTASEFDMPPPALCLNRKHTDQ
ncbi:hypothetical protein E4U14_005839 [Claviceps sp. LM454 group G7]|nr:hypothetical protein E4U14_005839 [Claviceps sp. LM454 group G7]